MTRTIKLTANNGSRKAVVRVRVTKKCRFDSIQFERDMENLSEALFDAIRGHFRANQIKFD